MRASCYFGHTGGSARRDWGRRMTTPPFTTVVALDREHFEQFALVWPTWAKHRPEILAAPLLLICDVLDETGYRPDEWERRLAFLPFGGDGQPPIVRSWHSWPCTLYDQPSSIPQRERMLTALVKVPPWIVGNIGTPYWLKLDCDAVAMRPDPRWCNWQWFDGNPAIVASPWGFTKPADALDRFDAWAKTVPTLAARGPVDWQARITSDRVCHHRIISWCMFCRTDFSQQAASFVEGQRLPLPSQDTYHYLVARTLGETIYTPRMKRHGWAHCLRMTTLRERVREAMQ